AVVATSDDREQLRPRAFAYCEAYAVQFGSAAAEDQAFAARLAGRERDVLPLAERRRRERLQRREIGIAPFLVAGGGICHFSHDKTPLRHPRERGGPVASGGKEPTGFPLSRE